MPIEMVQLSQPQPQQESMDTKRRSSTKLVSIKVWNKMDSHIKGDVNM